jgi:hypothetical protein
VPQCFNRAVIIKHLELYGACLLTKPPYHGNELPGPFLVDKWHNLETIRMQHTLTTGAWWYQLCQDPIQRLKSIDISVPTYFHEDGGHNTLGYSDVFLLCSASLERLRFCVERTVFYDSHLGPTRQLSCLPFMSRLRHLEVSVPVIFRDSVTMEAADICDHLPPSLESIYLREAMLRPWQRQNYGLSLEELADLAREHSRFLKRALLQLVRRSERILPLLKSVHLCVAEGYWVFDEAELEGHGTSTNVQIGCLEIARHIGSEEWYESE